MMNAKIAKLLTKQLKMICKVGVSSKQKLNIDFLTKTKVNVLLFIQSIPPSE
jgi:hypothetical protein